MSVPVVDRRRIAEIAALLTVVVALVLVGPGLGSLRRDLAHASAGWVLAGVAFEVLSALCYVLVFRTVFDRRMSWRLSLQIGMSEQAANSMLSASGAGGLALGAWALRRVGMSSEHIARRTVAFFLVTSLANVGAVVVFAALYAAGILGHDPDAALTYGFGVAAALAAGAVLALPRLLARTAGPSPAGSSGRVQAARRFLRDSLAQGVRDAVSLVRRRSLGVLAGSVGTMAFDLAVLAASFAAFGHAPPLGVLVLGYLIGQLGGNLPLPGGIGGLDGGLIGVFVLYHQPVAATAAAVLVYHAISLWIPALLGSVAFVQLRRTLRRDAASATSRDDEPAPKRRPLAEPMRQPILAG